MPKKSSISRDQSEVIALKALAFLAVEPDRINRFMGVTGTTPESIRGSAGTPDFLAGVLDYVCGDQSLLLLFAESEELEPQLIETAGQRLTEG